MKLDGGAAGKGAMDMDVVVKQSIGEFIRDNGGNAWVALGHALQALEAAEAEVGELKVQIRALQINATPRPPGEAALEILLARQQQRAETAEAECERLREVLADIAEATDAADPESYRSDDPHGCLDYVYAKAMRAQDAAGSAQ